ncbi:MAG: hypothetical protein AAF468_14910 [Pseudomonadota bacterium]
MFPVGAAALEPTLVVCEFNDISMELAVVLKVQKRLTNPPLIVKPGRAFAHDVTGGFWPVSRKCDVSRVEVNRHG